MPPEASAVYQQDWKQTIQVIKKYAGDEAFKQLGEYSFDLFSPNSLHIVAFLVASAHAQGYLDAYGKLEP